MMRILAYDSYFYFFSKKVILVKKGPKDSQPLRIMILIKMNVAAASSGYVLLRDHIHM